MYLISSKYGINRVFWSGHKSKIHIYSKNVGKIVPKLSCENNRNFGSGIEVIRFEIKSDLNHNKDIPKDQS